MLLRFEEYLDLGGSLSASAFSRFEKKAEYLIRRQAAGLTGERIDKLPAPPQAVKDCIFDLIAYFSGNTAKQIASESQSQGGVSESVSYVTKTPEQIQAECENIIRDTLFGGGCGELLYRGADV
nr:MAG TPA: Head Tail Connector Protein [Caudoviricetes sp.]